MGARHDTRPSIVAFEAAPRGYLNGTAPDMHLQSSYTLSTWADQVHIYYRRSSHHRAVWCCLCLRHPHCHTWSRSKNPAERVAGVSLQVSEQGLNSLIPIPNTLIREPQNNKPRRGTGICAPPWPAATPRRPAISARPFNQVSGGSKGFFSLNPKP